MATHNYNEAPAPLEPGFTLADYLNLPPAMTLEQSALLEDGRILTVSVDARTGEFVLVRHLKSGWLDKAFGAYGTQRITSDIARSVTSLALRLEADGRVVARGKLTDPVTGRQGVYLLRVQSDQDPHPRLGIDAFLIVSLLPTASVAPCTGAVDEWTWLRWPSQPA